MQMKVSNLGDSEIHHIYCICLSFAKWTRRDFAANMNFFSQNQKFTLTVLVAVSSPAEQLIFSITQKDGSLINFFQ